jgi:hypothetical protein
MTLKELFTTFHDFDIVGLKDQPPSLWLTLRLPWGELWDNYDFKIRLELQSAQIIECKYSELTGDVDRNSQKLKGVDKITTDFKTIEKLGLDIQRIEAKGKLEYVFHCNGDKVAGAHLTIVADSFNLYDHVGQPISHDNYKSWYSQWWKEIREM